MHSADVDDNGEDLNTGLVLTEGILQVSVSIAISHSFV